MTRALRIAVLTLLWFSGVSLYAQGTKPNIGAMRGPAGVAPVAVIVNPDGSIVLATLDSATLTIDTSSGKPVLKGTPAPTLPPRQVEVATLTATAPSYTLRQTPTLPNELDVAVNGLLLSPGDDYTLAGAVITWTGTVPGPGDKVRAAYR